jgi:hypothetical protein
LSNWREIRALPRWLPGSLRRRDQLPFPLPVWRRLLGASDKSRVWEIHSRWWGIPRMWIPQRWRISRRRLASLSHHIPQYCAPRRKDLERVPAPLTLRVILEDSEKCRRIPPDISLCTWAKGTSAAVMGAAVSLMDHTCTSSARFMPSVVPQCVSRWVPTDVLVFTAVLC